MITSIYYDVKTTSLEVKYDNGYTKIIGPSKHNEVVKDMLPFNLHSPTLILTSLVVDLIERVEQLEMANV